MANGNGSLGTGWIWPSVIAGVLLLLQGFSVFVWSTITAEQSKLEHEVVSLRNMVDKEFLRKDEANERRQLGVVERQALTQRIQVLDETSRRMRDIFLRKDDFDARHAAFNSDLIRLNNRLDETRKEFGSTYTLSDKLKELQGQIRAVQDRLYNIGVTSAKPHTPSSPSSDQASPP